MQCMCALINYASIWAWLSGAVLCLRALLMGVGSASLLTLVTLPPLAEQRPVQSMRWRTQVEWTQSGCSAFKDCLNSPKHIYGQLEVWGDITPYSQVTAVWPNSRIEVFCFVFFVQQVTGLFQRHFRGLNCEKLIFVTFVDDLLRDKLTTRSIFLACTKGTYCSAFYKYPSLKIKISSLG